MLQAPKAWGLPNPKSEARNPKQAPRGKIQIPKRHCARWFWELFVWEFGFVSVFGLRISVLTLMSRWYCPNETPADPERET